MAISMLLLLGVATAGRASTVAAIHDIKPNPDYLAACVDEGPVSHDCIWVRPSVR
ncbi:MAG TPA: hypothetical protein VG650_03250 [Mycobacteriales bacterium]|nr:hypothetical protein [Mycobacteriales bacterium]